MTGNYTSVTTASESGSNGSFENGELSTSPGNKDNILHNVENIKNSNIKSKIKVSVYSIKPFYDKHHFLIEKYNELKKIKNEHCEHFRVEEWLKTQLPYRRYRECTNNNCGCFSQSIDMDGVQIIQDKFKEEQSKILDGKYPKNNNTNTETSINKNNIININEDLKEEKIDNKENKNNSEDVKQSSNKKEKFE